MQRADLQRAGAQRTGMQRTGLQRPGLAAPTGAHAATDHSPPPWPERLRRLGLCLAPLLAGSVRARHAATVAQLLQAAAAQATAGPTPTASLSASASASATAGAGALRTLRAQLTRAGLPPQRLVPAPASAALIQTCAAVHRAAQHTLGLTPHHGQWLAALAMLEGRLVELATGEGKTLALALAAALGALHGFAVHAVTANDYLVQRDAEWLAPFYAHLGLRCATVLPTQTDAQRRSGWAADVAYCSASTLVFDHLRDQLAAPASPSALAAHARRLSDTPAGSTSTSATPRLRGLQLALLDEADSVLLDEAVMPLVLSEPVQDPQRQALLWRALRAAKALQPGLHALPGPERFSMRLTEAGRTLLDQGTASAWPSRTERDEWVARALGALHRLQRDRDYLVADEAVHIIDEVTGRRAEGRVWSQGLHALVALKEGLVPPAETRTLAQQSCQQFFNRYRRLGGMSGTLAEGRAELRSTYGLPVLALPTQRPSRRAHGPDRLFANNASRWLAVARRCAALRAQGRAVLVGTDSVADAESLSAQLATLGLPHAVLHARQDAAEAEVVAAAGQPGRITVATRMAGRGTDITLAPEVAAAGGLHVLNCQRNPSARLDRQLAGRAARQGQPGSSERWHCLARAPHCAGPGVGHHATPRTAEMPCLWWLTSVLWCRPAADNPAQVMVGFLEGLPVPAGLLRLWAAALQNQAERRARALRGALAEHEHQRRRQLQFAEPWA